MSQFVHFYVRGDTIIPANYPSFNSGSKGYYTAQFDFDEAWEGLIPHIVIIENGTKRADEVIVDSSELYRTHKIAVTESGTMKVSVYGLDAEGNKCISCNYVVLSVQKGSYDKVPSLPSNIWESYQITVLGYVERVEIATSSAVSAAQNVKKDAESVSAMALEVKTASKSAFNAVNSIKKMTVEATSGTEADVSVSETEDGMHLAFVLPEGDKGNKGDKGAPGADGYTPKKGVDYWTEADKAEIKGYVDSAILGGAW